MYHFLRPLGVSNAYQANGFTLNSLTHQAVTVAITMVTASVVLF